MTERLHFSGVVLPDGERRDVYVVDGHVTYEPARDATTVASDVWLVPGLVDAHCHVGLGKQGAVDEAEQERQATRTATPAHSRCATAALPRTRAWIDHRHDLPEIIRHGRHIARPKRHTRDIGVEVEPSELVHAVEHEIERGDGWVKLVGDWIDRDVGDLAPLWPLAELTAAIARAHELGARVTAHVFGEDALPDLIAAGIDCIEHGTGVSPEVIDEMAQTSGRARADADQHRAFPEIAEGGNRFPTYGNHMRALHRTVYEASPTPTTPVSRSTRAQTPAARCSTAASPTRCWRYAASACRPPTRSARRPGGRGPGSALPMG